MAEPTSAAELLPLIASAARNRNLGPRIPADLLMRLTVDPKFAAIGEVIKVLADTLPADHYTVSAIQQGTSRDAIRLTEAVTKASQEGRFK